ncbi:MULTISPECIES: hypothetical protein [Pseudomonas]|uniref:hypothetical protein n=1 Tax=Pseudomonas TaxID=286 RepID=UPI00095D0D00|nr:MULTISPECIES: hypothetical protein [Pseudomonas]OLU35689.1 hypothetical protein BVH06_02575 [Pseudomonas sp. PA27(2017)]
MSKKAKSGGAQKRQQEKERDLAKAEKRRALEKERAAEQLKKTVKFLRSGKVKLKKSKQKQGVLSTFTSMPCQPKIRREDVVIDEHTSPKKEQNPYRLEGDTGWV